MNGNLDAKNSSGPSTPLRKPPTERRRPERLVGAFVLTSMLVTVAVIGSLAIPLTSKATSSVSRTEVPPAKRSGPTTSNYAIRRAIDEYYGRGGRYIWGSNDCSTFVTRFLKASGTSLRGRITTRELFSPAEMKQYGLRPVRHAWTEARPNDILVYRYWDAETGEHFGHCGVLVQKDGVLSLLHNSMSQGGLSVTPMDKALRDLAAKNLIGRPRVFRKV